MAAPVLTTREEGKQLAEMIAAGKVPAAKLDAATAALEDLKARLETESQPAPQDIYQSSQPSPDQPVGFDTRSFWDMAKQLRRGITAGAWTDPESEARLRANDMGGVVTGANIAGGMITGTGVANLAGRGALRQIAAATGEGGFTAAMYAEPGERGAAIGAGATIGGGIAALFPGGAAAFHAFRRRWPRMDAMAKAKVLRELSDQIQMSPEQIRASLDSMGPEAVISDLGSAGNRAGRLAVADAGLRTQDDIAVKMGARANTRTGRLMRASDQVFGEKTTYAERARLAEQKSKEAGALYDQAFAPPSPNAKPRFTPKRQAVYQEIMKRDVARAGLEDARKIANAHGKTLSDMSQVEQLHFVKLALGDKIASASTEPAMRDGLIKTQKLVVGLLDDLSPEYKQARSLYADAMVRENAIKQGESVMKGRFSRDEVQGVLDNMSPPEREAFMIGAKEHIANKLIPSSSGTTGLTERDIEMGRYIFGEELDFDGLVNQIRKEQSYIATEKALSNVNAPVTSDAISGRLYVGPAMGSAAVTLAGAAEEVAKRAGRLKPAARNAVAEMLTNPNITEAQMEAILRKYNLYRPGAGRAATATAPAAGVLYSEMAGDE